MHNEHCILHTTHFTSTLNSSFANFTLHTAHCTLHTAHVLTSPLLCPQIPELFPQCLQCYPYVSVLTYVGNTSYDNVTSCQGFKHFPICQQGMFTFMVIECVAELKHFIIYCCCENHFCNQNISNSKQNKLILIRIRPDV